MVPSDNNTIAELEIIMNEAVSLKQCITKSIANISQQCGDLSGVIERMRKVLNDELDQLKESVTQKSELAKKNYLQCLGSKYSTCEHIERTSGQLIQTSQHKGVDGIELDAQANPLKTLLKQQMVDLHTLDFTIEFDTALTSLLREGRALGRLHIDKRDDMDATPVKPVALNLMTSMDLQKTAEDKQEPLYASLAFLSDGRLVAIDNANGKLYVMNEALERLGEYTFPGARPYSVAVATDDHILVTYGRVLFVLQISPTNVVSIKHAVKVSSMYCSVCFKDDSTFVASTWDGKRPVRMITMGGKESDFPWLPDKEYKRDASACAFITQTDTLILTDRFEHVVFMYDTKDRTRRTVKDENIKEPMGACEGPNGTVFVCSQLKSMLVQLSPSGKVMNTYKLDMKYPLAVSMSKDGTRLVVANRNVGNKKILLFSIV